MKVGVAGEVVVGGFSCHGLLAIGEIGACHGKQSDEHDAEQCERRDDTGNRLVVKCHQQEQYRIGKRHSDKARGRSLCAPGVFHVLFRMGNRAGDGRSVDDGHPAEADTATTDQDRHQYDERPIVKLRRSADKKNDDPEYDTNDDSRNGRYTPKSDFAATENGFCAEDAGCLLCGCFI